MPMTEGDNGERTGAVCRKKSKRTLFSLLLDNNQEQNRLRQLFLQKVN